MPWGPNNKEAPGSCDDEQSAYLVSHPDIAMWRWAYLDLYYHWLHGEPLPADYLDTSLQHLCGGLTWSQFSALLRSPPPDPRTLPTRPGGYAEAVPQGLCSKSVAMGNGIVHWTANGAACGASCTR